MLTSFLTLFSYPKASSKIMNLIVYVIIGQIFGSRRPKRQAERGDPGVGRGVLAKCGDTQLGIALNL